MVRYHPRRPRDGTAPQYENDILAILAYCSIQQPAGKWIDVKDIEKATGVVYRRITRIFFMEKYKKGRAMEFIAERYNYQYKLRKFPSRPGTFNGFKWCLSVVQYKPE